MSLKNVLVSVGVIAFGGAAFFLPKYAAPDFDLESMEVIKVPNSKAMSTIDDLKLKGTLFGVNPKAIEAVKETSLHLSLKGTAPANEPSDGFAVVLVNGRDEKLVSVGDDIVNGVTLYQVKTDYVLINRGGSIEKLSFPNISGSSSKPGNSYFLADSQEASSLQNVLKNGSLVKSQAKAKSNSKAGIASTFKTYVENKIINHYQTVYQKDPASALTSIGIKQTSSGYLVGAGSLLLNFGLNEGDVVLSVNGMRPSQIMGNPSAISQIRALGVANMEVERNGSVVQISRTF